MRFMELLAPFWKDDVPEQYHTVEAIETLCEDLALGQKGQAREMGALSWYLLTVRGGVAENVARQCVRQSALMLANVAAARLYWVLIDGKFIGVRSRGKERWWDKTSGAEIPQGDVFRRPPVVQFLLDPAALYMRILTANSE